MKIQRITQASNSSIFGFRSVAGNHFSVIIDCDIENLWLVFFESGSGVIDDIELSKQLAFSGEEGTL